MEETSEQVVLRLDRGKVAGSGPVVGLIGEHIAVQAVGHRPLLTSICLTEGATVESAKVNEANGTFEAIVIHSSKMCLLHVCGRYPPLKRTGQQKNDSFSDSTPAERAEGDRDDEEQAVKQIWSSFGGDRILNAASTSNFDVIACLHASEGVVASAVSVSLLQRQRKTRQETTTWSLVATAKVPLTNDNERLVSIATLRDLLVTSLSPSGSTFCCVLLGQLSVFRVKENQLLRVNTASVSSPSFALFHGLSFDGESVRCVSTRGRRALMAVVLPNNSGVQREKGKTGAWTERVSLQEASLPESWYSTGSPVVLRDGSVVFATQNGLFFSLVVPLESDRENTELLSGVESSSAKKRLSVRIPLGYVAAVHSFVLNTSLSNKEEKVTPSRQLEGQSVFSSGDGALLSLKFTLDTASGRLRYSLTKRQKDLEGSRQTASDTSRSSTSTVPPSCVPSLLLEHQAEQQEEVVALSPAGHFAVFSSGRWSHVAATASAKRHCRDGWLPSDFCPFPSRYTATVNEEGLICLRSHSELVVTTLKDNGSEQQQRSHCVRIQCRRKELVENASGEKQQQQRVVLPAEGRAAALPRTNKRSSDDTVRIVFSDLNGGALRWTEAKLDSGSVIREWVWKREKLDRGALHDVVASRSLLLISTVVALTADDHFSNAKDGRRREDGNEGTLAGVYLFSLPADYEREPPSAPLQFIDVTSMMQNAIPNAGLDSQQLALRHFVWTKASQFLLDVTGCLAVLWCPKEGRVLCIEGFTGKVVSTVDCARVEAGYPTLHIETGKESSWYVV